MTNLTSDEALARELLLRQRAAARYHLSTAFENGTDEEAFYRLHEAEQRRRIDQERRKLEYEP